MLSDAGGVSRNGRLYLRSYRKTWDPDEYDKPVHLIKGCNTIQKGNIK